MPTHCKGVTTSDKIRLAERMAIGNSIDVNILATPPETNGAPAAKNNGGSTAPNNETPTAIVNKSLSNGSTVGMSRMNTMKTKMVEPVTIKELRVHGSTLTATFPLQNINPAYVNAERIPKINPLYGRPLISPFTKFEAKKTPINISTMDNIVRGAGFILLKIHSKIMPIQTNWNIKIMASDAGKYSIEP